MVRREGPPPQIGPEAWGRRRRTTYPGAVPGLSRTTGRPPLSYRWALRPGWILSHLFVLACVVLFVRLGFWQLSRLGERRAHNALIEARQQEPPAPVGQVVAPTAGPAEVDAVVYRTVVATGTYRTDEQVLVRNESYRGAPGSWVVTPLVLADGRAVAVNRGWIPAAAAEGDPAAYAPPAGTVTVTGLLARTEEREGLGAADAAEGRLRDLARVDVGRLARQVAEPLYPAYLTLRDQQPAAGTVPVPVPPGVLDDGPHLNYAGQWFIFATLTAVVYPLLLRRQARARAAGPDHGDGAEAEPVATGVG
jgi:cytochrome oxidase assembly protein ShyY1